MFLCILSTLKIDCILGKKKWKKTCCVPSFVIFIFILGCLITGMALLAVFKVSFISLAYWSFSIIAGSETNVIKKSELLHQC